MVLNIVCCSSPLSFIAPGPADSKTRVVLTLHTASHSEIQITIRNGVGGQEKSAFYNGVMVAGTSRSGEWKHLRRQDHVYVAPGFDVLVAIGIAFVRVDKQTDDDDMDDFGII